MSQTENPGAERARELADKAHDDGLHNLAEWLEEIAQKEAEEDV